MSALAFEVWNNHDSRDDVRRWREAQEPEESKDEGQRRPRQLEPQELQALQDQDDQAAMDELDFSIHESWLSDWDLN